MIEELGICVNLLKTIVGGGILYFPMLFHVYGWLPTILITIFSSILSICGLLIFSWCSIKNNRISPDMSTLADDYVPNMKFLVDFFVFFKCFGVATAYLIITKQTLRKIIIDQCKNICLRDWIILLIFMIIVAPFTFFRKLTHLKYTSSIGIVSIFIVLFASIYRFITLQPNNIQPYSTTPDWNWLKGIGSFIFAFTCHQNLLSLQNEIHNPKFKKMVIIILISIITSLFLYITFGYVNSVLYNSKIHDNILESMPSDRLSIFIYSLYIVVMAVSYPLQLNPCRLYFFNLIGINVKLMKYRILHNIVTFSLLLVTYIIAVSGVDLGIVYAFIGSSASTMICLFFPSIIYFNMDIRKNRFFLISSGLLFCSGIFVTIIMFIYYFV